jgi:hypothetical protein
MKRLVMAGAAILMTGAAVAASAGTGGGMTPINCMDTVWRSQEVSTSSTSFEKVPGFVDAPASVFPIRIDVSALVSGAPVEFRVLNTDVGAQTDGSRPGPTRFVPTGGGPDAFSYQWIEPNQSAAVHATDLRLQWRSPSGNPVHMLRGDMSVEYRTEPGACTG